MASEGDTDMPASAPPARKRRLSATSAAETGSHIRSAPSPPGGGGDDADLPTKTSSRLLTALKSRRTNARRRLETANEALAAANEWLAKTNERVAVALKQVVKVAGEPEGSAGLGEARERLAIAVGERPEAEEHARAAEEECAKAYAEWTQSDRVCRAFKA